MTINAIALEFLGQLEEAEWSLLSWGLIDGFFSEDELEQRAEEFLASQARNGIDPTYDSPWTLIESLLDENFLWRAPNTERYRTRMAQTVRLSARLRQIFADPQNAAWRTAPNLVSDYRLVVRSRLYPIRDVSASNLVATLRHRGQLPTLQVSVINSFLKVGTTNERLLAGFQARATERITRMVGQDRSFGTVVCAGTGSGKTVAFYLPAFMRLATRLSAEYWTKCLAIYPRNELLKDQLREVWPARGRSRLS